MGIKITMKSPLYSYRETKAEAAQLPQVLETMGMPAKAAPVIGAVGAAVTACVAVAIGAIAVAYAPALFMAGELLLALVVTPFMLLFAAHLAAVSAGLAVGSGIVGALKPRKAEQKKVSALVVPPANDNHLNAAATPEFKTAVAGAKPEAKKPALEMPIIPPCC